MNVALNLPASQQGKRLGITAFAIDQAGRVGYAVPITHGGAEGDINAALNYAERLPNEGPEALQDTTEYKVFGKQES